VSKLEQIKALCEERDTYLDDTETIQEYGDVLEWFSNKVDEILKE
jgi:hypothetical protein